MAIAIFTTWTTYGTWLPGDERGWYRRGLGRRDHDPVQSLEAIQLLSAPPVILDDDQRPIVERTVEEHCAIRHWTLYAVRCLSNHVHVVVAAPNRSIEVPREQFKAWCTRRLKEHRKMTTGPSPHAGRDDWWTERGWDEWIDDEPSLAEVIAYVLERQ